MQTLKPDKGGAILSWTYFHGRLQDKTQTDLVQATEYPPCGVTEVQVEGVKEKCLAFIWTKQFGKFKCGLITIVKDRKATLDAYQKYFKRVQNL